MASDRRRRPAGHESRVFAAVLLSGLPAIALGCGLLWTGDHPLRTKVTFTLLVAGAWLIGAALVRERVLRPLQTIANLLAALREGDYSIRARGAGADDGLSLALLEINTLSDTLRSQRRHALEATALLRRVMEEIDVAVFAFDGDQRLRLVNRGGERLLGQSSERLIGLDAAALGLGACLDGETPRTIEAAFPGGTGRWELRGSINNSLAPIKSIAGSLRSLAGRTARPADWEQDLHSGLQVIEARSESLARFMGAYARLARLPHPQLGPVPVAEWVHRVAALERRIDVRVIEGPPAVLAADGDQLDQLLINLVRNAADAALESGGGVSVGWRTLHGVVEVTVDDEGPGLPDPGNLFVPFFTTKAAGSGIGLVLSRQIAEGHGGAVALTPRPSGRGARATLRLPLGPLMSNSDS
jgi:two-component system nitrogen regulation sensor histidine kinase NtrY